MTDPSFEIPSIDEVAEKLSKSLDSYLRRFVGDPDTAQDLLQETMIRISNSLPGFQGRSSLKNCAFKLATNTTIDHIRKGRTRSKTVELEEYEIPSSELDRVGERFVIDEMNSCVREEIDSLPEAYRAAIILHDLEGLTAAETAEISGCSLATAKIRIHRARARLEKVLQRDCIFYHDRDQVLRCDRKNTEDDE